MHIIANDIGSKRHEVMWSECRELGKRLKNSTSKAVIYGLLQRGGLNLNRRGSQYPRKEVC